MLQNYLRLETLETLKNSGQTYIGQDPFPHIVIDDFLSRETYQDCVKAFPTPEEEIWDRYKYKYQVKLACNDISRIPAPISDVLNVLNSAPFLKILEKLTEETGLISDPYLVGGGLHQIEPGGSLSIHADFNQPPHLKFYRRLNLIIYLNESWDSSYGSDLELWDKTMSRCEKKVSPVGNRCVIFTTDATSYHGHPHPLNCPPGMTRKSMAVYYYALEKPKETTGVITLWQKKGESLPGVAMAYTRRRSAKFFWWISQKMAALAGRLDV